MAIIDRIVVTPSMGIDVPVDVGVVEVSIDVIPVDVVPVNVTSVTPVDVAPVDVAPVDIPPIDVAGRSVSDRRPRTAPASGHAGLRYRHPHATHNQGGQNYDNPSHVSFLFSKDLFLPIYSTLRSASLLEKTVRLNRISPNGHRRVLSLDFFNSVEG
jgi:hypothetical protein